MNPSEIANQDPTQPRYRDTPTGEVLERIKERQHQERKQDSRPMNMERDCSWENTNFEGSDYD